MELASEKLEFLRDTRFSDMQFETIRPDKTHNWLNLAENDWDELIPVASKEAKLAKGRSNSRSYSSCFRSEWSQPAMNGYMREC